MDNETIKATAEATKEVAKTTGQAIELTQGVAAWIGEVLGRPLAEAMGLYVTDRLQAKRVEAAIYDKGRFVELLRKLDDIIDGEAITIRPLPPKVALPLLDAATMEFDERLQGLWANLLATAINADEDPVERQYVSILSDLSVADAEALEGLWKASFEIYNRPFREGPVTYGPSLEIGKYGDHVGANLIRLGLVAASTLDLSLYVPSDGSDMALGPSQHSVLVPGQPDFVAFTGLGRAFCRAVGMKEPAAEPA